ncbi:MAG: hydrogenase nickel incorporation protein HypB [Burkholderiales bacterium]|nr:hydrogenase nickel incorporation protein HypB [Burkholderiales bacterium]
MCTTCGCGEGEVRIEGKTAHHDHEHSHDHVHADGSRHSHGHDHDHGDESHEHPHAHEHPHSQAAHAHAPGMDGKRMVQIEQDILAKNNAYAQANRQQLSEKGIFALNLVSSPGSGKTTLLCKTITLLEGQALAVIEGDQQTTHDAERIRATGAPAIQINTGKGCHLDAHMVGHAMEQLDLQADSLLMIENVGNLVCPAAFDLGEAHKVVILSVTEGEDKPLKYPDMFRAASLMLLNKIDLLPYLSFDVAAAIAYARRVNPRIRVIELSATSGVGMDEWLDFLRTGVISARAARQETVERLKQRIATLEARLQQRP